MSIKQIVSHIVTSFVVLLLLGIAALGLWPHTYNVMNGSMEPTVAVGTKVFVDTKAEIAPQDIIVFRAIEQTDGKPVIVTHRFIGYNDDGTLITKGDANNATDFPVVPLTNDDVIGVVVHQMPHVGAIHEWVKGQAWAWVCVILGVFLWWMIPALATPKDEAVLDADTTTPV